MKKLVVFLFWKWYLTFALKNSISLSLFSIFSAYNLLGFDSGILYPIDEELVTLFTAPSLFPRFFWEFSGGFPRSETEGLSPFLAGEIWPGEARGVNLLWESGCSSKFLGVWGGGSIWTKLWYPGGSVHVSWQSMMIYKKYCTGPKLGLKTVRLCTSKKSIFLYLWSV